MVERLAGSQEVWGSSPHGSTVDMSDLETRIDELYASPLDTFIASRDALAKEMRAAGDGDGAKRVKSLRKPVVPAFAVNRLVHEDPGAIDELLGLGERLRAEQRRARR